MSSRFKNFKLGIINSAPILILYYLSISNFETQFNNMFEILSFNLQYIVIFYWSLKNPNILGSGHIFFAGIINDVVLGLPMGLSSLSFLVVALVASYVRQVTVNTSLISDLFTFFIAIFFSNLTLLILIYNFTKLTLTYTEIFYNSFFTIIFYPFFWVFFNIYRLAFFRKQND